MRADPAQYHMLYICVLYASLGVDTRCCLGCAVTSLAWRAIVLVRVPTLAHPSSIDFSARVSHSRVPEPRLFSAGNRTVIRTTPRFSHPAHPVDGHGSVQMALRGNLKWTVKKGFHGALTPPHRTVTFLPEKNSTYRGAVPTPSVFLKITFRKP